MTDAHNLTRRSPEFAPTVIRSAVVELQYHTAGAIITLDKSEDGGKRQ